MSQTPLQDSTPTRSIDDFDVPADLYEVAKTADFGEIRVISLKLLSPLEEKTGVSRAKGDALRMAYELADIAIYSVTDAAGNERKVYGHDGSLNMLVAQMHPKLRSLVIQGYGEMHAPSDKQSAVFSKSRRTRLA